MRPALMARSTEDLATPVAAAAEARSNDIAAGCAGLANVSLREVRGDARRMRVGALSSGPGGGKLRFDSRSDETVIRSGRDPPLDLTVPFLGHLPWWPPFFEEAEEDWGRGGR
jgi:hypothetical protein